MVKRHFMKSRRGYYFKVPNKRTGPNINVRGGKFANTNKHTGPNKHNGWEK